MVKVLFFSTDYKPGGGGIAEHTWQLARHLHGQKIQVSLLSLHKKEDTEFDQNQQFMTYRVPVIPFCQSVLLFCYLAFIIKKEKIDIVFSTITHPCAELAFFLSCFKKITTIISVHGYETTFGGYSLRNRIKQSFKFLRAYVYNHSDALFAVSTYTRKALIDAGTKPHKIRIMPNGIEPNAWQNSTKDSELIAKYHLQNKKILLSVSALTPRKGHDSVIKALEQLHKKFPQICYLIAGEGPDRKRLETLAKSCNVLDLVIFLGKYPQNKLKDLYATCDIFVMPNRTIDSSVEGFGIVFLEANACRKPVIGGKSGGTSDVISENETGFLVGPKDEKELIDTISLLLKQPRTAEKMGEAGYNRATTLFSWNTISKEAQDCLLTLQESKQ